MKTINRLLDFRSYKFKIITLSIISSLSLESCSKAPNRVNLGDEKYASDSNLPSGNNGDGAGTVNLTRNVSVHRLNNREYNATVRDLLQTALQPADNFPTDTIGSHFDNEGGSLSISPTLAKYYFTAAISLSEEITQANLSKYTSCTVATDTACLTKFIQTFGARAWRRPLEAAEVTALATVSQAAAAGGSAALLDYVRQTVFQLLLSPNFVFRVELDANPANPAQRKLNAYELASRLSYFLWSSMPDAALFAAAADGSILTDAGLQAHAKRMLEDSKAVSLVKGFGSIWLHTDKVRRTNLDPGLFPKFTPKVREAMAVETESFIADFLKNDVDVSEMLTADFSFMNDELAAYYGLPLPNSATHVRVEVQDVPRQGVLSHGSFLTATSAATRTSIVRRGAHVLETFLCSPKLDLPAGLVVEPLPDKAATDKTVRQTLADHVALPACAGCHLIIDPPGFAMEAFGADGLRRTKDGVNPVDSTGSYKGTPFADVMDFRTLLQKDQIFRTCVAKKVIAYGLGRALGSADEAVALALDQSNKAAGGSLHSLITKFILSTTFRSR